ncbi:MAG: 5-formyltetrahydrofolate cyclo-ligase [Clostridia bacterium]|nr:5-formyltetrahydrofolate cyclo-ligase [Clostridia bacterium]
MWNEFIFNDKSLIRKAALKKRSRLVEEEAIQKSGIITSKLLALQEFNRSDVIMCYMDFRNEVRTGDFNFQCIKCGKRLALPKIIRHDGKFGAMVAVDVTDCADDFEVCAFGILEPRKGSGKVIMPSEIDMVIVPGVAFDVSRFRMGYGGGFYDSFLKQVRADCVKVGIAFELQILEELPVEPHDIRLDMIVTESRIII